MEQLSINNKYKVIEKYRNNKKEKLGILTEIHKSLYVFKTPNYRTTVSKADIISGNYEIKPA